MNWEGMSNPAGDGARHEGFHVGDPTAFQIEEGLVMQDEFLIHQRGPQGILQGHPLFDRGVHVAGVELEGVAAFGLRGTWRDRHS